MKTLNLILILTTALLLFSCNSQKSGTGNQMASEVIPVSDNSSDNIEAYYFHFTVRCVTCRTIEESTRTYLQTLYPEHTRTGIISFKSLNLDEDSCKTIASKFGVSGQTLLLVKGDQKINLTNEGFLYAVPNPDKFKQIINEKVEFLLTR